MPSEKCSGQVLEGKAENSDPVAGVNTEECMQISVQGQVLVGNTEHSDRVAGVSTRCV